MKAVAVIPGKANSIHLADLPKPSVHEVPDGRGVLVQVLRVGVDGTDKEINAAEYGQAPPGYGFLVIGHECFGRVLEIGPNVTELIPGDYVVPTVRRPGGSFYDQVGQYDMTLDLCGRSGISRKDSARAERCGRPTGTHLDYRERDHPGL